jgi:hypothetical protein
MKGCSCLQRRSGMERIVKKGAGSALGVSSERTGLAASAVRTGTRNAPTVPPSGNREIMKLALITATTVAPKSLSQLSSP